MQKQKTSTNISLVVNAASNWVPLFVNAVIGFLMLPYLMGYLGDTDYGIWVVVGSFVGYYGFLRLGIGSAIMRYVPFYHGRQDSKSASEVVSTAMAIYTIVGLFIISISVLCADKIALFLEGGPTLAMLVRIMGIAAAVECPMRILDASLRSCERWVIANYLSVMVAIVRALGLVVCVQWDYGVVGMSYVILGVSVFSFVMSMILFARFCPQLTIRPAMVKLSQFKALLGFGLLAVVAGMVYTLRLPSHNIIIGKLISLQAVTLYYPAVMLMKNVRQLTIAPIKVLWPRFAYLDGEDNREEIGNLFLESTKYCSILSAGLIFMVIAGGSPFIRLWVGERFSVIFTPLVILAVGYLIETCLSVTGSFLSATGHQLAQAVLSCVEGVLGLVLSVLLIGKFGLVGVTVGFLIAVALIQGIARSWYVCRLLKISLLKFYEKTMLRPVLLLAALVFVSKSIGLGDAVSNWFDLVVWFLLLAGSYTILAYFIATDLSTRRKIVRNIQLVLLHLKRGLGS